MEKWKFSSQRLLIKPGQYVGDSKSVHRHDYKEKKLCCHSQMRLDAVSVQTALILHLRLAENFVAA